VAYHESFWLAVAAATPIIALANTVAVIDCSNLWLDAKTRRHSFDSKSAYYIIIILSVLISGMATVYLWDALESLLRERDYPPGAILSVYPLTMAVGLISALLVAAYSVMLRYSLKSDQRISGNSSERSEGTDGS
jgi:uncharacterized membrane protein YidH (DUF202 family)